VELFIRSLLVSDTHGVVGGESLRAARGRDAVEGDLPGVVAQGELRRVVAATSCPT
jgi:hypothetical protein